MKHELETFLKQEHLTLFGTTRADKKLLRMPHHLTRAGFSLPGEGTPERPEALSLFCLCIPYFSGYPENFSAYAAAPDRLAHPSGEVYKALVAGYWKEREKQPGDCFAYSEQYELGQRIVSLSQFIMMWLHPYLIVRKHREKTEKGVQLIYAIDSGKNPPLAQNRSFSKHSRFSFLDAFRRIDVALRWPQGVCPAVQHTFQKSLYHNSAACSLILNDDNIYLFAV